MAKNKKTYIFYGSPFRSRLDGVMVHPYVVGEFNNFKKVRKYLNARNWNLLYEKDGKKIQFMVMNVEEAILK